MDRGNFRGKYNVINTSNGIKSERMGWGGFSVRYTRTAWDSHNEDFGLILQTWAQAVLKEDLYHNIYNILGLE